MNVKISKTLAGNYEIDHPYFKNWLFQDRWQAVNFLNEYEEKGFVRIMEKAKE